MSRKIECTECAGMGKKLIRKAGKVVLIRCKKCHGKGKLIIGKKVQKVVKSVREERRESRHDRNGVKVIARGPDRAGETVEKMNAEQRLAKETIEERAAFFGCPGKVTEIRKGPVITLYEFLPSKATRIKRLINLQEDLALALSAEAVMVRRIPGRDVMGIEISNAEGERQNVAFRASLAAVKRAKKAGMELPLNLGTDPFGDPVIDDLATMPHLLVAGSTGSGKSVSLNCIISSLLTVCSPQELEFYMIDPKGVELTHYNGIPHMKEAMVTSPHYAKDMLERLVLEMRRRLMTLTYEKVRDLKELNDKRKRENRETLPRIVLVVDELGDLMLQDRNAFIKLFAEISQIARATGIHMICATQRPSVDVLPGKVKVNFPGRMAFKVTSQTDSKVIVHRKGAEGLLGRGDMLYLSPTRSSAIRIHAPWVPLEDVKTIAAKLKEIEEKRLEDERKREAELEAKQAKERALAAKRFADSTKEDGVAPAATIRPGEKEQIDIDIGWSPFRK